MRNLESGPRWLTSIPPATRNLIIINVLIWLAEICVPAMDAILSRHLALHFWESDLFNPVQFLTYMFMHDSNSVFHVLFNMFTLYMFGRLMEQVWGTWRFLLYYFVCGVGAALIQELVWHFTWMNTYVDFLAQVNHVAKAEALQFVKEGIAAGNTELLSAISDMKAGYVCIGASGAVFGILLAFAFVFPNIPMYLFFIPVPVKAKYMVGGYAVLEFFLGVAGSGDTVAHFAHLGGMLFGIILLLYWKRKGTLHGFRNFYY